MYREHTLDARGRPAARASGKAGLHRRSFLVAGTAVAAMAALAAVVAPLAHAGGETRTRFKRIPTQYIAALSDPYANSGSNAQSWSLWRQDPGPRGVSLDHYERLKAAGGVAPAQWKFESTDWWLEEHGLNMEQPEWCFRNQLLLLRSYLVLTKPLSLDIQHQRCVSVKIGCKYIDN